MEGVRERKRNNLDIKSPPSLSNSSLKKFDLFPKVDEDYMIKTQSGGYISLISGIILFILLLTELSAYIHTNRSDYITVRDVSKDRMFINFNITMYRTACAKIVFDLLDEDGIHSYGSSSQLIKIDLNENGTAIQFHRERSKRYKDCGNCYGAGEPFQCCNTCSELKDAYKKRGWDTYHISQFTSTCNPKVASKFSKHAGCMIYGALDVNRVSGDVHIAAITGLHGKKNVQLYDSEFLGTLNSSHYINHFSFGDPIPGVSNPLDRKSFISTALSAHEYRIEVLPASFHGSSTIQSNEFAAYESDELVTVDESGVANVEPGVFFKYKISPFTHVIKEQRPPFMSFVIRVCAVFGGAFAVMEVSWNEV